MKLVNLDNERILAWEVQEARTFLQKMKGMVFTQKLQIGSALHIHSSKLIYPFFIAESVDVLHLDSKRQIVGIEENVYPGTEVTTYDHATSVVKLPAGRIKETETKVGQAVQFKIREEILC